MGRIGITYHDVTKAIAELQGKQKNPTVDNIREVLGTGSKSTIAKFLREWKAKYGLQSGDDGSIPSELLSIIKALWDRLQEKADNITIEYQRKADAQVEKHQQQFNQSKQQGADLQAKLHKLEEQLHQQNNNNQQLDSVLAKSQQEKIKLTERITSLESRRQENIEENERLHQLLNHVQKSLEHYQTATQELRQEQSLLLEKQRNEYEQKIVQLQKQVEILSNEKLHLQVQYDSLNTAHKKLDSEYQALMTKNKEILSKYELLKITHDKTKQDYEYISQEHGRQTQNMESKQHTIIELQVKLTASDDKVASLLEALAKAEDKIQVLRHDYQFAAQEKANFAGQVKQLQAMLTSDKQKID